MPFDLPHAEPVIDDTRTAPASRHPDFVQRLRSAVQVADPAKRRRRQFAILGAVVAIGAVGWAGDRLLLGGSSVSTDNAYVGAETAVVTPQVAAAVTQVPVHETQQVRAGQVLVVLDDSDARVAVARAQAQLGQAERKVRGYFANEQALGGQIAARNADIGRADAQAASAQADLDRAKVELGRRQAMASTGAVSGDELTAAQNSFATARAALDAARAGQAQAAAQRTAAAGTLSANTALIDGATVESNPEVAAARAELARAQLDLDRTVIRAPVDGVIARKQVEVGQRVPVGASLMSVVPVGTAYVDANFKEVQLTKVRPGQPVVLTSDLYGSGVKFHGRVTGLAGGTGSAFALLPAQNATGNWIKIVQRLPVRVTLDPAELQRHPLRVGLSMSARIDTSKAS